MTTFKTRIGLTVAAALTATVAAASPASAGLVGHWEFELAPGNITPDSSGNGHSGTFEGNAALAIDGERGNVLFLSGLGSNADAVNVDTTVPIPNLAANGGATLAAWIKRNADASAGDSFSYILGIGASGNAPVITLGVNAADNTLRTYIEGDGGSDQVQVDGDTAVVDGQWTHVAVTYDRVNNLAITYVNGVAQAVATDISLVGDGELAWTNAVIGRLADAAGTDARHFGGLIDDARYYDEVLSASQIANLANVPEPASLALLGLGGLLMIRRRR